MSDPSTHFTLCLNNGGYPASLEVGKLYRVVEDAEAALEGYIRVIDESGEDYAFATNRFHVVELSPQIEKELLKGSLELTA